MAMPPLVAFWLAACLSSSSPTTDLVGQGGAGSGGSGGTIADGGTTGSMGGATGSGGTKDTGGETNTGGTTRTGGSRATGGSTGTGSRTAGATGTGGTATAGGVSSTGGRTAAGGASSTGGRTAAGGATNPGSGGSSGQNSSAFDSIHLVGNQILDCNGNPIIARGPEDVVASASQTADVDQAAAMGANAMRMLFTLDEANGMSPAAFDKLLAQAVLRHMLVWVSLYTWDAGRNHVIASALGGGNFYSLTAPAGVACSSAAPASCYLAVWSRQWLKDLMSKYRGNVIIDAGQEFINPGDGSTEAARVAWATAAKTNIKFFRDQGYTNPLEIMANYQGRDLYCIVEYGGEIRATDTLLVDGNPQTMFGWQAYWGTTDGWYPSWQGGLLLGRTGTVSGPDAIHQFAAPLPFPVQIGIDNYATDTNKDYQAEIDQAAADGMSWLWWSWKNGTVECAVSGATCQAYVTTSENGFKGAKPLSN